MADPIAELEHTIASLRTATVGPKGWTLSEPIDSGPRAARIGITSRRVSPQGTLSEPIDSGPRAARIGITSRGASPQGTLAKAVAHCAQSIECSLTGYPKLRSGLFRATIGPIVKRKFLRAGAMSHDLTAAIPGAPALADDLALATACDRADAAVRAFAAHPGECAPHLAYGHCTRDEYAQLHLLHLQDHLRGFGLA